MIWENSNRYCSDGSDGVCTLVDPSEFTLSSCGAHLAERAPIDYYDGCRWKAQNVSVSHNIFAFEPTDIGSNCTVANYCGENGLFSTYGEPPYGGPAVPTNITFRQNNDFSDNVYDGPWGFEAWSQGNLDNPVNGTTWTALVTDDCSTAGENASGTCDSGFGQDVGSTFDAAGGPVILSFSANPISVAVGGATELDTSAVGGIGTVRYTYLGLPGGCSTGNTLTLACLPRAVGDFVLEVYVNDTAGHSASATASLEVNAPSSSGPGPSNPSPAPGGLTEWIYAVAGVASAIVLVVVAALLLERRRARTR